MNYDRIKASLVTIVRSVVAPLAYHGQFPCLVQGQDANGLLALTPDDPTLAGLDHVPLRLGLPGCKVKVAKGSRVLLAFENGDPARPVATLWELSSVLELSIAATVVKLGSDSAAHPVAQGDTLNQAILKLATNIATAITTMGGGPAGAPAPMLGGVATAAGATITAAVTQFLADSTAALSPNTKTT